tara:strand:- start:7706 stop:7810 length:105 start_codon:yes stop_codon:yes gene_type:complete
MVLAKKMIILVEDDYCKKSKEGRNFENKKNKIPV